MNSYNPNKDMEVAQPPSDGISCLAFSPKANYLVASSWDNQVPVHFKYHSVFLPYSGSLLGSTKERRYSNIFHV